MSHELFVSIDGHEYPSPKNQYALVLHTLMKPPTEISMGYWMQVYKTHKFSTRLGELEKKLGHKSQYTVYTPILSNEQYLEFYNKVNK